MTSFLRLTVRGSLGSCRISPRCTIIDILIALAHLRFSLLVLIFPDELVQVLFPFRNFVKLNVIAKNYELIFTHYLHCLEGFNRFHHMYNLSSR
jgi:hypothetical protein